MGLSYYDEPPYYQFPNIAARIKYFEQKYPDGIFANCLLPNYLITGQQQGIYGGNYEDYISNYCESVLTKVSGTKWLSADFYPFRPGLTRNGWLSNLEILAKYGKMYDAHTHIAMQSGDFASTRMPSETDIRLQLYTSLAFGFRSISYFMYFTQDWILANEGGTNCIIDSHGEKTELYDIIKASNAEVKGLESAYLNFEWQGICPVVGSENPSDRTTFSSLENPLSVSDMLVMNDFTSEYNALVGQFTDKAGNEGYMIVNYADPLKKRKSNISADYGKCSKALVYRAGKKETIELDKGKFNLKLEPGEGIFVIPYTE